MKKIFVILFLTHFATPCFAQLKFYDDFKYLSNKEIYHIDKSIGRLINRRYATAKFTSSLGNIGIIKRNSHFSVFLNKKPMKVIAVKKQKHSLSFELVYESTGCKLWLPRAERRKEKSRVRLKYDYWIYFNVPNAPSLEIYPVTSKTESSESFAFFNSVGGFFFDWQLYVHQFVPYNQRFKIYLDWEQALWEARTLFYCQWNDLFGKEFGTHMLLFGFRKHWGLYRCPSPSLKKQDEPSLAFFLKPYIKAKK